VRTAVAAVRSALFALLFYGGTVGFVFAALVGAMFGQRPVLAVTRAWAAWFALTTRVVLGIRYRVDGTWPARPVLAAFKHQAAYETILIVHLLGTPAAVMKVELTRIPLWSRVAMLYGMIPVDRDEAASALKAMVRAASAARDAGRSVVIFPEGTRALPGEAPPLKAGLAGLYRALKLPLVPVAVDSGRLWPKGFVKYPGVVTFRIGEALPPGLDRETMEARVHAAINALNAGEGRGA